MEILLLAVIVFIAGAFAVDAAVDLWKMLFTKSGR
jgi:hypothetical protein